MDRKRKPTKRCINLLRFLSKSSRYRQFCLQTKNDIRNVRRLIRKLEQLGYIVVQQTFNLEGNAIIDQRISLTPMAIDVIGGQNE